jgi:hypothetical protein
VPLFEDFIIRMKACEFIHSVELLFDQIDRIPLQHLSIPSLFQD